ncbi:hypothetical protein Y032_0004g2075 [Ancylostoma ceylanicum]|uniref:DnaK family protein n=1 Tax=Ancylostoma ceylanicum TaxID=53326 RepID=A0A016VV47_9BILA|nr:hypothetical protein Y032_0004g2075 [Ancylostoma ceylanicum]
MKTLLSLAFLALFVIGVYTEEKEEKKETKYGTIIGIDLGTTYSCVGVYKNGRVEIIANDQGKCIGVRFIRIAKDSMDLLPTKIDTYHCYPIGSDSSALQMQPGSSNSHNCA